MILTEIILSNHFKCVFGIWLLGGKLDVFGKQHLRKKLPVSLNDSFLPLFYKISQFKSLFLIKDQWKVVLLVKGG